MGSVLARRAYTAAADVGLPNRACRLLAHMSLAARDDAPVPLYYGGQLSMAKALGRTNALEDPQGREAALRCVRRALADLTRAGLIRPHARPAPGRVASFELHLPDPATPDSQCPPSKGPARASTADTDCPVSKKCHAPDEAATADTQRPPNSGHPATGDEGQRRTLSDRNGGHLLSATADTDCPPDIKYYKKPSLDAGERAAPDLAAAIASEQTWPLAHADLVVREILEGRHPANPLEYLRAVIRDDPARFRPTRTPAGLATLGRLAPHDCKPCILCIAERTPADGEDPRCWRCAEADIPVPDPATARAVALEQIHAARAKARAS